MATPCDPPGRPCILIIEDDPDLVALLFSIMVPRQLSVVAASDGQQALDLLEHGLRPHVILIELQLPRVSGLDVLHHIRTEPALRAIPRIVITGAAERRHVVGADAVVEKPFEPDELLAAVQRLVRLHEPAPGAETGRRPGGARPNPLQH